MCEEGENNVTLFFLSSSLKERLHPSVPDLLTGRNDVAHSNSGQ